MTGTDLIIVGGIVVIVLSLIVARTGIEIYSKNPRLYKLTDLMVYGSILVCGLTTLFTIVMITAYWM